MTSSSRAQRTTVVSGDAAHAWVNCYYNSITKRLNKLCEYPANPNIALVSNFMCAPTDEEALAIANGTDYGLGSGLWTSNLQRAHRFARDLHAGMVWINSYKRVNPGSPFGGVGQSGYGREMGFDAMREYTQVKSVWVNVDAQIPPHFAR